MRRWAALVAWPFLVAAGGPAPVPHGFVAGVNGVPRALENAYPDARAAGFRAVRILLRWEKIETTEGAPDWSCRYLTQAELGPDVDGDGTQDPWPGLPCDAAPCGCGISPDDMVGTAAAAGFAIVLDIAGTPAWARGEPAAECPDDVPPPRLPLRRDKAGAFRDFVAAAARRYGDRVYAFELWSEPDLPRCRGWGGTRRQYKEQILSAAAAVKSTGASPGLVVAPSLEEPSGAAMDAWMDWSQPIDLLSFNLYREELSAALATIDEMSAWCRANRRCTGFYVGETGAQRAGAADCPGPRVADPGAGDVALLKRCRSRRSCAGLFLYTLSSRTVRPECDRGLLDTRGCRRRRLCTIARRFFGLRPPPFTCVGCGP